MLQSGSVHSSAYAEEEKRIHKWKDHAVLFDMLMFSFLMYLAIAVTGIVKGCLDRSIELPLWISADVIICWAAAYGIRKCYFIRKELN